jgi:hypothetical protein
MIEAVCTGYEKSSILSISLARMSPDFILLWLHSNKTELK